MSAYLAIGALYLNEGEYLREWIEFHRLVGVERFFLYDHESEDDHLEVLAPYVSDGTVVVHDWPIYPGQKEAYDDCVATHRDDARWIAFVDVDEFLFSPTGRPLSEVLRDYERWPGVGVNIAIFGTSGHRTKPAGLVIENYTRRGRLPGWNGIKSIVDPRRAVESGGGHHFLYSEGFGVDELFRPLQGPRTETASLERLRVNHYYTKSEQDLREKWATPRADNAELRSEEELEKTLRRYNVEEDDSLLRYVTALREALALVEQRAG